MGKQKRSENTYQKINTIFKRDKYNIIMPYAGYVDPVFNWLKNCKFECSEKVDGTNCRIEVSSQVVIDEETTSITGVSFNIAYKGKTDNAQLPKMLEEFMKKTYTPDVVLPALGLKEFIPVEEFADHNWGSTLAIPLMWTIYGEGYGVKIQAGGNYLADSNSFIGFDIKVTPKIGQPIYLLNETRDEIMKAMGMPIVPTIGYFTIKEAIEYVKKGFKSTIAVSNPDYLAEGLVCKSPCGILNRRGERIVFKVKTCDWNKYYAKYGTYDPVEQETNEHY